MNIAWEVIPDMEKTLGTFGVTKLAPETEFASRVLWPRKFVGKELFVESKYRTWGMFLRCKKEMVPNPQLFPKEIGSGDDL